VSRDAKGGAVYFVVSSGGRHTRWPRDWSSDVCSSDLVGRLVEAAAVTLVVLPHPLAVGHAAEVVEQAPAQERGVAARIEAERPRSEERRVGKEGRSWWVPCDSENEGEISGARGVLLRF